MDASERAVAATTGVTRSEEQTIDSGGHARSTWRLEPAPPEANAARPGSQAGSACVKVRLPRWPLSKSWPQISHERKPISLPTAFAFLINAWFIFLGTPTAAARAGDS